MAKYASVLFKSLFATLDGSDNDGDNQNYDHDLLPLHEAGVHIEPAVVDATIVVVLEAHVEQDDERRHAPTNLRNIFDNVPSIIFVPK